MKNSNPEQNKGSIPDPVVSRTDIEKYFPGLTDFMVQGLDGAIPVLALSGGMDSSLLFYIVQSLYYERKIAPPVIFHLDHKIRSESEDDRNFVCHLQDKSGFEQPAFIFEADVSSLARKRHYSVEEAGRILRYSLLRRIQKRFERRGQRTLALLGHHADDYAESLLIHLIRGGGRQALATMPFFSNVQGVFVFRPLMQIPRQSIAAFVDGFQLPFIEDASNAQSAYLRNRLRKIIPRLKREGFDPVRLFKNFHEDFQPGFATAFAAQQSRPCDTIKLDRNLFQAGPAEIKPLFDIAMKALSLPPLNRSLLNEILRQMQGGRIKMDGAGFIIWSGKKGPVSLFRKDAAVLQKPFIEKISAEQYRILYNRKDERIDISTAVNPQAGHARITTFEAGMIYDNGRTTKKLKKHFQETNLPAPVRPYLPLLEVDGRVVQVYDFFLD